MRSILVSLAVLLAAMACFGQGNITPQAGSFLVAGYNYDINSSFYSAFGPYTYTATACQHAITLGTRFRDPFVVGAQVLITDSVPANTETVAVVSETISGNLCILALATTKPHVSYHLTSGTYGLQEAINDATSLGGGNVVVDYRWRGVTSQITNANGNTSVSITDNRTGSVVYSWNGTNYAVQSNGGVTVPAGPVALPLGFNSQLIFGQIPNCDPTVGSFFTIDTTGSNPKNLNSPLPGPYCAGNGPYWLLNPSATLGNTIVPQSTAAPIFTANYASNPTVNPISININGTPKFFLVPFNNSFQLWLDSLVTTNANGVNQANCAAVPGGQANPGSMLWGCKSGTKQLFSLNDAGVETDYIGSPVALGTLATQNADTVVMNASGSTATPTAVAMPTSGTNGCAGGTNALTYNTTTHALGCNTLTSTGITSTSWAFNQLSAQTPTSANSDVLPVNGAINTLVNITSEAQQQQAFPFGGTVIGLTCRVSAAEGAAATLAFVLQKCTPSPNLTTGTCSGSPQTVTCTIGNSSLACSDTSHSFTFLAGDFLDMKLTQTGTGTSQTIACTTQYTVP